MMNLFLDKELTKEETESIKKKNDEFMDEIELIIKKSNVFEEGDIIYFKSKRKFGFKYNENDKLTEEHFLKIHLSYYYDKYNKGDGWNGFYIELWELNIEKEKRGFLFKTEMDVITKKEKFKFYPTLIGDEYLEYHQSYSWNSSAKWPLSYFVFDEMLKAKRLNIENEEWMVLNKIFKCVSKYITKVKKEIISKEDKLLKTKNKLISKLDKDGNGKVDFIDSESYDKLLSKNQKEIIEIDKKYIQKFVKISIYLKTKKNNTQKIFESINGTKDDNELTELINLLKNQIHTYDLLVFHSISMMISLIKNDLISFYEIYECLDQLGVFNSNWENEVSEKLTDIGDGINELMYSINKMENKIVSSIDNLTYVTKDSFRELSDSVEKQLTNIDSTIKFNNFLNVIQTYQMYKINKNTKRLS
jgi:hypothetical protein